MCAIQHLCMSLKVDVSRTKLIYVTFEFVLLRITIIYLTKHPCIHVRNLVCKKNPYVTGIYLLYKHQLHHHHHSLFFTQKNVR